MAFEILPAFFATSLIENCDKYRHFSNILSFSLDFYYSRWSKSQQNKIRPVLIRSSCSWIHSLEIQEKERESVRIEILSRVVFINWCFERTNISIWGEKMMKLREKKRENEPIIKLSFWSNANTIYTHMMQLLFHRYLNLETLINKLVYLSIYTRVCAIWESKHYFCYNQVKREREREKRENIL